MAAHAPLCSARIFVGGEVAGSGFGPVSTDRREAGAVGGELAKGVGVGGGVPESGQRIDQGLVAKLQEDPATFLAALDQPRVGEDLEVPADPRLALLQNLRDFGDGEFRTRQQSEQTAALIDWRLLAFSESFPTNSPASPGRNDQS